MKGEEKLCSRKILGLKENINTDYQFTEDGEKVDVFKFMANTILDYNLLRGDRPGRIKFATKPRINC